LLHGSENFGRMSFGWRFIPNFSDAAIRPDQKRGAHDSQERFAEELLHPSRSISFDGLEFRIAQQGKIQIVLGREFGLSFHFIAAAAQYDRGEFVELRFGVAKLGRFVDSTRGERLGKKIEHHRLAAQAGKRDLLPVVRLQPEIRGFVARLEHFLFAPNFVDCFLSLHPSNRFRISLTVCGLARPREAFMTWPTNDLNTPSLPARYLATLSGFFSTTSWHMRSISPVS